MGKDCPFLSFRFGGWIEVVLETDRLYLRQLSQGDFMDLAEILKDPEVMYAYEHDFTDEDVQIWLDRQLNRYQKDGFGLWALVEKGSDRMVGEAGLTIQDCEGQEVLEIGYQLKKRFWHRGYAREAAAGCRDYAFGPLDAPWVCAIIKADNRASIRVAEAIGMTKEKEFITRYFAGDMLHYLFGIHRS